MAGRQTQEYGILIEQFCGKQRARRSGASYIRHIWMGTEIARRIGISHMAFRCFVVHPIFQNDLDLLTAYQAINLVNIDPRDIITAMEYRKTANSCLPTDFKNGVMPKASCFKLINEALVVDKIQNMFDMRLNPGITDEGKEWYESYFRAWLCALGQSMLYDWATTGLPTDLRDDCRAFRHNLAWNDTRCAQR